MAKKADTKAIVKEEPILQEVKVETPITKEEVKEEVKIEEVVEKAKEVKEEKPAPVEKKQDISSQVKVIKIVQKTPSGYRLLLETGEIVRVSKKDYTKGQEFITI